MYSTFHDLNFYEWLKANSTNQLVHRSQDTAIKAIRDFIWLKAREFLAITTRVAHTGTRETIQVGRTPPPPGFIKFNTDGSASPNPGQSGAGGIIRGEFGNWGYLKLVLEIDCKVAVSLLENGNYTFHSLSTLISDCRRLMTQIPDLGISHIMREANSAAHLLAKFGARMDTLFVVFNSCPPEL
ncbi:hypothetical protein SLEP1_g4313 [Rubroshorea leprosula]|uniref:RNase H type-1 domain-containing protein n=1 Tax=Rubroshorea leprosula TaxID=152421 RepID=A0AAV5HNA4_9ROSI|nr:hypothetical protein SLEP1_g4313 [Rubroshorea leprosula]